MAIYSKRKGVMLSLGLILVLLVILAASVACWGDPLFKLILENQTEYELTVYVNDYEVGNVSPGKQIIDTGVPWNTGKYHVEAKNTQGEIIFSEILTRAQMQRIESLVWKVVIPPSQKESANSDNVTAK